MSETSVIEVPTALETAASVEIKRGPGRPRKEVQAAPAQPAAPGRTPCVGLPVQFFHMGEGVVPGILQSENRTEPGIWNVRIFLGGAHSSVTRYSVHFSETPKAGCWNFLPS